MKLTVFSHKPCWPCTYSTTGFATDGGFSFQMQALSELFDETLLVVPVASPLSEKGWIPLSGRRLQIKPLSPRCGVGLGSKLSFLPWMFRNARTIARELWRADTVHAPIPGDVGTVGMLGAWLFRKPLMVRYCGNWMMSRTAAERFWHWFMESFAGGRNVMFATGGAKDPPSPKTVHMHWVFSTALTESELAELATHRPTITGERLRLITVGRQERGKGTSTVIEALPLIHRLLPATRLDIVGDGTEMGNLKRQSVRLGLGEHVTFYGKVDHNEVLRLMKRAHLFCFPTQSEGFPKVVIEALACGLPVIATPVSVLPTLLGKGGGILVPPNPSAIAEVVCALGSSSQRYDAMSVKAHEIAGQYSLEAWRDQIGSHLTAAWGPLRGESRK